MKSMSLLILNLLLCDLAISAKLPKSFNTCHRQDANFQQCLEEAVRDSLQYFNKPYPSLGMNTLDPYFIEQFSVNPGNKGTVNFIQNYKNMKITGLKSAKLNTVNMDFDKKQLTLSIFAPTVEVNGNYDINGKLLVLPIKGNGKCQFIFDNLDTTVQIDFNENEKNNKKYYNVTNVKVALKLGNAHLQLDNLFDGNKELGDNINKILNENWREAIEDVQGGYEELLATIIKRETTGLFSHVPIDEIFPN